MVDMIEPVLETFESDFDAVNLTLDIVNPTIDVLKPWLNPSDSEFR